MTDSEKNRAVPVSAERACHCDIEDTKDGKPDACVFDSGDIEDCIYAVALQRIGKDQNSCEYWKPLHQVVPVSREVLEELQRDAARLDWMEAHPWEAYRVIEEAGYACDGWSKPGYRSAIDAEMKATP